MIARSPWCRSPSLNLQFVPHAGSNREEIVLSCTNYVYIMQVLMI